MKGRKIKIKKQRRRRRRQRRRRKKAKNEEINPHSKQPSSCEPKHVTNFQMTNPSILLFFFVSSSPPDANFFFFFFLVLVISIQAIEILQEPVLSFVLIFSFMNPSMWLHWKWQRIVENEWRELRVSDYMSFLFWTPP